MTIESNQICRCKYLSETNTQRDSTPVTTKQLRIRLNDLKLNISAGSSCPLLWKIQLRFLASRNNFPINNKHKEGYFIKIKRRDISCQK